MCEDLGMQVMGAHVGRKYTKETDAEVMEWWKEALDAQAGSRMFVCGSTVV